MCIHIIYLSSSNSFPHNKFWACWLKNRIPKIISHVPPFLVPDFWCNSGNISRFTQIVFSFVYFINVHVHI